MAYKNKTVDKVIASVKERGYFIGRTRREYMTVAKMCSRGLLPVTEYEVKLESWNAGTHGRYVPAHEAYVARK